MVPADFNGGIGHESKISAVNDNPKGGKETSLTGTDVQARGATGRFTPRMSDQIINDLLRLAVENQASDIVCKTGKPALLRLAGRLKPVDMEPLTLETLAGFVEQHVPEFLREQMEQDGQIDFEIGRASCRERV